MSFALMVAARVNERVADLTGWNETVVLHVMSVIWLVAMFVMWLAYGHEVDERLHSEYPGDVTQVVAARERRRHERRGETPTTQSTSASAPDEKVNGGGLGV